MEYTYNLKKKKKFSAYRKLRKVIQLQIAHNPLGFECTAER